MLGVQLCIGGMLGGIWSGKGPISLCVACGKVTAKRSAAPKDCLGLFAMCVHRGARHSDPDTA